MVDENPYKAPVVDESKWFTGGHLGGQIQQINWQARPCGCRSCAVSAGSLKMRLLPDRALSGC